MATNMVDTGLVFYSTTTSLLYIRGLLLSVFSLLTVEASTFILRAVSKINTKKPHKITQSNTVTGTTDAQGTDKKLDCTTFWQTHTGTLSRSGPLVYAAVLKLSLFHAPNTLV